MKVSLKWLREYVDPGIPVKDLARRLTLSVAEVEEVIYTGGWDSHVRVGQVLRVEPHPNADRLRLATVTTGGDEQTVVCGAPNIATGQKIAFATEGAELRNGHSGETMVLKASTIRGVRSAGMVLSERELGISENHEGILVLPEDAPLGTPLRDYLGDVVLDLSSWANRPDLLSVLGVAREVAALTGQMVREPDLRYAEEGGAAADRVRVRIDAPDLCRRYLAAVIDKVTVGPSPGWMQERLAAAGMRPINVVVDITNYVMLEYGQPLHAFDYDKVRGHEIVVRRAKPGERMTMIDDIDRALTPDMLMIADGEGSVAVAGVMGGAESEVSEATRTVLLEAASFHGPSVRRTGQALRLRTEASARFEKGLSPDLPELAARRAVQLLVELAGGVAAKGFVDAYPGREQRTPVIAPAARLRQVLGIDIPAAQVRRVLTALGFTVDERPPDTYVVQPPYWRMDVRHADDIAEELIRIIGYDDLPNTTVSGRLPPLLVQPERELRERVKDLLVQAGMQEVITYALVSMEQLRKVLPAEDLAVTPPLRVANPQSMAHEYLRTTKRGSILETVERNLRRPDRAEVAIFEAARVYIPRDGDLPDEEEIVTGAVGGRRADRWGMPSDEPLDFYDAKGYLDALFDGLHLTAHFAPVNEFGFVPGRCAEISVNGERVGVLGQVHPSVRTSFDIDRDVFLFEVRLRPLLPLLAERLIYRPMSRFEALRRDLALMVDAETPSAALQAAIARTPLVVDVRPFDEFRGGGLPEGKRSLAFAVTFQAPDRTLADTDVDRALTRLLRQLERDYGAVRR